MLRFMVAFGLVASTLVASAGHAATLTINGATLTLVLDAGSNARLTDSGGNISFDVGTGFSIDANANIYGFADGQVSTGSVLLINTVNVSGAGAFLTIDLDDTLGPALSSTVPTTVLKDLTCGGVTFTAAATLGGSITVQGSDDITLAAVTLTHDVAVRIPQTLFSPSVLRLNGPIDSDATPRALTLESPSFELNQLGQTSPLASLAIIGDQVLAHDPQIIATVGPIDTSAAQSLHIPTALTVTSGGGNITLGDTWATSGTPATPVIVDARGLTTAGVVTLGGVGTLVNVDSLTVYASGLTLNDDVITKGVQIYNTNAIAVEDDLRTGFAQTITFRPLDPTLTISLGDGATTGLVLDDDVLDAAKGDPKYIIGSATQSGTIQVSPQGATLINAADIIAGAGDVDTRLGALTSTQALRLEAGHDFSLGAVTAPTLTLSSGNMASQVAALSTPSLTLVGAGSFVLDHTGNQLDQVGANVSGGLVLQNSEGLRLRLGAVSASAITINSAAVAGAVIVNGLMSSGGGPILVYGRATVTPSSLPAILISGDIVAEGDTATGSLHLVALPAPAAPGGQGIFVNGGAEVRSSQPDGVIIDAESGTGAALSVTATPSKIVSTHGLRINAPSGLVDLGGVTDGGESLLVHADAVTIGTDAVIGGDLTTIETAGAAHGLRLGGDGVDAAGLLALSIAELARIDATDVILRASGTLEIVDAITFGHELDLEGEAVQLGANVTVEGAVHFDGPTTVLNDVTLSGYVDFAEGVDIRLRHVIITGSLSLQGALQVQIDGTTPEAHGYFTVSGGLQISTATLEPTISATPSPGDVILLVDVTTDGTQGADGPFANYAAGALVAGTTWRIGYTLTTNDVGLFGALAISEADDVATVAEDGSVLVDVLDNDTGEPTLAVHTATDPPHGTTTIEDGQVRYAPDANYNGADTFSYEACDEYGQCASATVTVTVTPVNDAPVAVDDTITTNEETAVTIPVLANDSDIDGDALTVGSITDPFPNGTLTIVTGGILFTPAVDVIGDVTLHYVVRDPGGLEATGTVTVTIEPDLDDDDDGLSDIDEATHGTDKDDADSDDDGVSDNDEVTQDLDPLNVDTDGDGILDGTELGVTDDDVGPATNPSVFVPDADPTTTTDPSVADSDQGGSGDGEEDADHNGRVDAGERDPNNPRDDLQGHVTGGGCVGGPLEGSALALLLALFVVTRRRQLG